MRDEIDVPAMEDLAHQLDQIRTTIRPERYLSLIDRVEALETGFRDVLQRLERLAARPQEQPPADPRGRGSARRHRRTARPQ